MSATIPGEKPFGQYTQRFVTHVNEHTDCWEVYDNRNSRVVCSCKAQADAVAIQHLLNAADRLLEE